MNRVELKPFSFEHLDLFAWRDDDLKTYGIRSELMDTITTAADRGECWTAIYDGRILVVGGVLPYTKKTGYCFTLFSQYADQHRIGAARAVRRMFNQILEQKDMHRVVTLNRVGAVVHNKWCEWLGFKLETPYGVKKYDDDGNDYLQYALTR